MKRLEDMTDEELDQAEQSLLVPGNKRSALESTAGGVASGVATGLGFPVDAINSALGATSDVLDLPFDLGSNRPLGGQESIRGIFNNIGIGTESNPDSFSGGFGQALGEAAPFGLGFASRAIRPIEAAFSELIASIGGATGRGTATSLGVEPDSLEGMLAEFAGGNAANTLQRSITGAASRASRLFDAFSDNAADLTVAKGLQDTVTDRELAIENLLKESPINAEFMSGAKSRDPALLATERALVRSGEHDTGGLLEREQKIHEAIKRKIQEQTGREPTEAFVRFVKTDTENMLALLDENIAQAMKRARTAASDLPPVKESTFLQEQQSKLARTEIDKAVKAARTDESMLWKEALGNESFASDDLLSALDNVEASRKAGDPPIPEEIITAFGRLGDVTDVENVQSVRSAILQTKRANNGSTAPDYRLNSLLDVLDEATMVAMGEHATSKAWLDRARAYSLELNNRFTRGPIGKVLGYDSRGGLRTPESKTLEALLATGITGRENMRALLEATADPETVGTVDRYIRARFAESAIDEKTGAVIPVNAQKFLNQHRTILEMDRFSPLKTLLEDAKDSQDILQGLEKSALKTQDKIDRSRLALFLGDEKPILQMRKIMNDANPVAAFQDLYTKATEDQSGRAIEGLKTLYAESMLDMVIKPTVDALGDTQVTESKLTGFISKQQENITKLYGKEGAAQINKALDGLQMLMAPEKARATKIGSDTLENLTKNAAMELIGSVFGVEAAALLPKGGAGTIQRPAIAARLAKKLFGSWGASKRKAVLIEAFKDPKKMTELLKMELTPETVGVLDEKARAWLIAAGINKEEDE